VPFLCVDNVEVVVIVTVVVVVVIVAVVVIILRGDDRNRGKRLIERSESMIWLNLSLHHHHFYHQHL
jgi:septation ring formation regulator EzrA